MISPANAGDGKPNFIASFKNFVLVHVAHHFDAFKASFFDGLHFFQGRAFKSYSRPHDGFLDGALGSGGFSARQKWQSGGSKRQSTACLANKLATIHSVRVLSTHSRLTPT